MTNAAAGVALPPKDLWRWFLILIPLVAMMAVGCYVHIRSVYSTYEAWTPVYFEGESFTRFGLDDVHIADTGVVRATDVTYGAGGAPATFVPSGGQGPDEVISEAQSMRDYLVSQGVSPDRVVLEDRSTTTGENMEFSRTVIEEHAGRDASELLVGFSTTNYHVFRGYVCAHRAGMAAQGMGSRTRAYFWPNAFLREFVGAVGVQVEGHPHHLRGHRVGLRLGRARPFPDGGVFGDFRGIASLA